MDAGRSARRLAPWQIVLLGALLAWLQLSAAAHAFEHLGTSLEQHAQAPAASQPCPLCVAFADSGNALPASAATALVLHPPALDLGPAPTTVCRRQPANACRDPPLLLSSI